MWERDNKRNVSSSQHPSNNSAEMNSFLHSLFHNKADFFYSYIMLLDRIINNNASCFICYIWCEICPNLRSNSRTEFMNSFKILQLFLFSCSFNWTNQLCPPSTITGPRPQNIYSAHTNHKTSKDTAERRYPTFWEYPEIKPRKIKAVTVDNAGSMDATVKRLRDLKIERFFSAQKIDHVTSSYKWATGTRAACCHWVQEILDVQKLSWGLRTAAAQWEDISAMYLPPMGQRHAH